MRSQYLTSFCEGLSPEEILTVDQWADKHRILSGKAAAEPGRYKTDRTPFLREIMRCLSVNDPTQEIVFKKSSQIGGTECGLNWIGYVIDHSPAPMMFVQPTVDLAKRVSKGRLDPLIDESPRLKQKVQEKRARDSSNTMLAKEFLGGILIITGANSAVGLRSAPCRYIFVDEVDAYPANVDDEGSPIELAKKRSKTFASKRKIFIVSTPTIEGRSEIDFRYKNSDQRVYKIPCPHCGHYQELKFTHLKWKRTESKKLIRSSVYYECQGCKGKIKNYHKTKFLKAGYWDKQNPEATVAGFFINELYSPVGWSSWEDLAQSFLDSKDNPEKLRTFVNTELGETWKDKSEVPSYNRLYERREKYETKTVPRGGVFLTMGVDVQEDRLELEIVAWGRGMESWSVDARILSGDTDKTEVWEKLENVLAETFPREDNENARVGIRLTAVDSGYRTQKVYAWVRKFSPDRVVAVKGDSSKTSIISTPTAVDVTVKGRRFRRGLKIWSVGVDILKTELYGYLRLDKPEDGKPYPNGYCHFPEYSLDFFKQLTAEELRAIVNKKGFTVYEFVKVRDRNEALDCRVYARAATAIIGADRFKEKHWSALEGRTPKPIASTKEEKPSEHNAKDKPKRRKRKRRESSWL